MNENMPNRVDREHPFWMLIGKAWAQQGGGREVAWGGFLWRVLNDNTPAEAVFIRKPPEGIDAQYSSNSIA